MSENYKPGDVVRVRYGAVDQVGIVRPRNGANGHLEVAYANGGYDMLFNLVKSRDDIRPLVVIDPENREQAERFALGYIEAHDYARKPWDERQQESRDRIIGAVQHGFRSLIRAPKPAEPTGLGAVVEDAGGALWVLRSVAATQDRFECSGVYRDYDRISAVRILSEGVEVDR